MPDTIFVVIMEDLNSLWQDYGSTLGEAIQNLRDNSGNNTAVPDYVYIAHRKF